MANDIVTILGFLAILFGALGKHDTWTDRTIWLLFMVLLLRTL
jgi:hypothetical protein